MPLTEKQLERSQQIVAEFTAWTPDTGPCPIDVNSHWFKKLCGLAENMAVTESILEQVTDTAEHWKSAGDNSAEMWVKERKELKARISDQTDTINDMRIRNKRLLDALFLVYDLYNLPYHKFKQNHPEDYMLAIQDEKYIWQKVYKAITGED